ncbi:PREDICTED: TLC domain-containing protein At5g14285-like [Ipomoea nil]|uniref:TLC domain-containing protein At5g14285-like n=1 Tax=Ipomoea nil TaxID=35883 RepID=UPI0009016AC4|nr:PREDICTED: TLC domain-containing protein At5g14285-like [Ipomoea nil]
MDVLEPSLVGFTLMFFCVYLLGYFIFFNNWNGKRSDASSCLMSLAHGTPAVILAITSMLHQGQGSGNLPFFQHQMDLFSSPNTPSQEMVLDFSIAYFLMDSLHYIIFYPHDALFIAHHMATLYVFSTCRFAVRHGATALLGLLVLAEITSPCQNTWSLARYRKVDLPFLSPIFYGFYSVVRGVVGPWFVCKMGRALLGGAAQGVIPKGIWVSWMVVIVSAIMVSILWVLNLWVELYRETKRKDFKKLFFERKKNR